MPDILTVAREVVARRDKPKPLPTITELEAILASQEPVQVHINPDGSVTTDSTLYDLAQAVIDLSAALKDHASAVENFRKVIADVYPDAARADKPYYTIRNHMAAVIRSLEGARAALDGKDLGGLKGTR